MGQECVDQYTATMACIGALNCEEFWQYANYNYEGHCEELDGYACDDIE